MSIDFDRLRRDVRRRRYRHLTSLPAWGLFVGDRIVASIRAEGAYAARDLFKAHGLEGERIRRLP